MMTRRQALKTAIATAAFTAAPGLAGGWLRAAPAPGGIHTVPPLPYPYHALEPHLDAQTMELHHSFHHAGYVSNLNRAVAGDPLLNQKPVDELLRNLKTLPEKIQTAVRNNGGGHANHSLFWQTMKPNGGGEPQHQLADAIKKKFGSFGAFKEEFSKAASDGA